MGKILVDAKLLREALELWRLADYHWSLEFVEVPDTVEEWPMEERSATFKALADLLADIN